ncbi:MAG TPA: hypothetical protein VNO52_01625 [Methylomirabilota bacterium]|nr:hypothetical protein [Methylomirabilota bacterium]
MAQAHVIGNGNGFLGRLARWTVRRLARVYYPNIEISGGIDRRPKELIIQLDEPSSEPFLNDLEVLLLPPRERRRNPFAWLRQRKRLADAMNHFMRADPPRTHSAS